MGCPFLGSELRLKLAPFCSSEAASRFFSSSSIFSMRAIRSGTMRRLSVVGLKSRRSTPRSLSVLSSTKEYSFGSVRLKLNGSLRETCGLEMTRRARRMFLETLCHGNMRGCEITTSPGSPVISTNFEHFLAASECDQNAGSSSMLAYVEVDGMKVYPFGKTPSGCFAR